VEVNMMKKLLKVAFVAAPLLMGAGAFAQDTSQGGTTDTNKPADTAPPADTNKPSDNTATPLDTNKPSDTTKPLDTSKPLDTTTPLDTSKPSIPPPGTEKPIPPTSDGVQDKMPK
jgi:hypothetical protein